jgi:hypothetical protein
MGYQKGERLKKRKFIVFGVSLYIKLGRTELIILKNMMVVILLNICIVD